MEVDGKFGGNENGAILFYDITVTGDVSDALHLLMSASDRRCLNLIIG